MHRLTGFHVMTAGALPLRARLQLDHHARQRQEERDDDHRQKRRRMHADRAPVEGLERNETQAVQRVVDDRRDQQDLHGDEIW